MRRDDALRILREHADEIRRHGATSLSIFGSTARDEARADSDVDILIEIDPAARPFGYFKLFDLEDFLSQLLGTKVDLVTTGGLRPEMRRNVLGEAVRAA